MKQILLVFFASLSCYISGQNTPLKVPFVYRYESSARNDTTLRIFDSTRPSEEQEPLYYLNGILISSSTVRALNPKVIESIRVGKEAIDENAHGQIFIETLKDYKFNFISLTDLKLKYAKLKNAPTIFMIDNELVSADYDKTFVDENYLLRISIETIENSKENLRFNLIQILTKTQENIKKVKEIRLRGDSSIIET